VMGRLGRSTYALYDTTTGQVLAADMSVAISVATVYMAANALISGKVNLGSANALDLRFWCDGGATCDLTLVNLQVAVGGKAGTNAAPQGGAYDSIITLTHNGFATFPTVVTSRRLGSGTKNQYVVLAPNTTVIAAGTEQQHPFSTTLATGIMLAGTHTLDARCDVVTDLAYWAYTTIMLQV